MVSYLLCWIPQEFVDLVDIGILVNPVECFFWASQYNERDFNTATLQHLDGAGLLR
jgi:hypothetical protein